MLLLSTCTAEVCVVAQGAEHRLGLNARRDAGDLRGQQRQVVAGSETQQVLFSSYQSSCDAPVRKTSWFWHPLSGSWYRLCPLAPPPPATTTASPREAAQVLVRGVRILSCTSVVPSHGRARSTAPLVRVQPVLLGSVRLLFPSSSS